MGPVGCPKALKDAGYAVGRFRARSLMKKAGLEVKRPKRFKKTTDSRHKLPVAPNRLNQQFQVDQPDQIWCGDITYLWTLEGWLYLAVIIDLYSRKVVGWALDQPSEDLVGPGGPPHGLLASKTGPGVDLSFRSGFSQYAAHDYQRQLETFHMIPSMSRKGDCYDNAVVESFFHTLKTEQFGDQTYLTREEARRAVIDYIEMFYNSRRLHSFLGYVSPNDFEKKLTLAKVA